MGFARESGIQRFELSGCVNEQWHRVPAMPGVQGDLPAQALEHGPVEVAQRAGRGGGEKRQGLVGCSGQVLGPRGVKRTPRPAARIGCQGRRALQEGGSRSQAAARLGPPGRALQLVGDVLVRRERRVGAVPGPAVRIDLGIGGRGQRQMRASAFVCRRGAVDRRPQQRVPEDDLRAEIEQAICLRGARCLGGDTQRPGRLPQQSRIAGRLSRGHQQQPLGLGRKLLRTPQKASFDPARQR